MGRCENKRISVIEEYLKTVSELDSLVLGACERAGVELIEKDLFNAGRRKILRIFIDRNGGVNVEHCAKVSRYLNEELDKEENLDIIEGSYTIEVSSPGLDRPLKTKRDFERNLGRKLRVQCGGKAIKGILKSVGETSITLDVGACIQMSEILTAKVEP